jgi:hypothetical protein
MAGIGATVAESGALAATVVAVVATYPQLRRVIVCRDVCGVSVTSGVLGVGTEVAWFAYTVRGGLWSAVPEAVLMAAANLTLVAALVRRGADARVAWRAGLMWVATLTVAGVVGGTQIFAATLAGAYVVQVAPAVWTAWVTPTPTGVATATWVLIGFEGLLWGVYGIAHADPATSSFATIAVVASTAMLTRKAIVAQRVTAHNATPETPTVVALPSQSPPRTVEARGAAKPATSSQGAEMAASTAAIHPVGSVQRAAGRAPRPLRRAPS